MYEKGINKQRQDRDKDSQADGHEDEESGYQ